MGQFIEFYQWLWRRLPRRFSIPLLVYILVMFFWALPYLTKLLAAVLNFAYDVLVQAQVCYGGGCSKAAWPVIYLADVAWNPIFGIVMILCLVAGLLVSYSLAVITYTLFRKPTTQKLQIHGPVKPERVRTTQTLAPAEVELSPATVQAASVSVNVTVKSNGGARGEATPAVVAELSQATDGGPSGPNRLSRYQRIGIILAGGGAKGAYQAGALKAIYEFLEENNAHHKVRMIAGTSIGSWNALFWLAGLIKEPGPGQKGLLEQWWNVIDLKSVIRPAMYYPLFQNYLLSNEPWKESFEALFGKTGNNDAYEQLLYHIQNPAANDALHFYFTRSNVARARLEFTCNRADLWDIPPNMKGPRPRPPVPRDVCTLAEKVDDIRDAVFSSMDLPPLFPYSKVQDGYFEDGGVIDNLPIRFGTEIEKCDLLFVLPLNANFEEEVDVRSIVKRLFRVMNVRQGVLERNAFKMVYLYNELAALRLRLEERDAVLAELLETARRAQASGDALTIEAVERAVGEGLSARSRGVTSAAGEATQNGDPKAAVATRAVNREHRMVQVFSICPAPKLLINTADFWKTSEAGRAFRLMYRYTRNELDAFDFEADPDWVRMAQVSPFGSVNYFEDF